jgi:UPF0716 family protein affecting phage T7 exclusion
MIFARHFAISPEQGKRAVRLMLLALLLWVALELLLMKLIANRFGWGTTVLLHMLKGGFGLLLVGWLTLRGLTKLRDALSSGVLSEKGLSFGFPVASAVLIAIPGLIPSLFGLALFSPSLRAFILKRFTGGARTAGPQEIDLSVDEWHEARKPRKPRKVPQRNASLERDPPSV